MKCPYCDTSLPATALFCGECGRSLTFTKPVSFAPAPVIEPAPVVELAPVVEPVETPEPEVEVVELAETPEPEPEPEPDPDPAPAPSRAPDTVDAISIWDTPKETPSVPWSPPARLLKPEIEEIEDLDKTRIVGTTQGGQRFVLQFSTGESVTIFGTGLVGRNPIPEPGEYFDQLVAIVDPGKSVSKTHLEFGQIAGTFWVSDRYSGNGTVVREPESAPKRCDPGKRYRIARGTRVSIGEQFFVVS